MRRLEVPRTGREVRILPVDEPEKVDASRVRPRRIEKGDLFRTVGRRHIVDPHSRVGKPRAGGLMRHREDRPREPERVAAHFGRDGRHLCDYFRGAHVRDVDDAETQRSTLVRQEEDPPAILVLAEREPFSSVSVSEEIAPADDPHVLRFRLGTPEHDAQQKKK